MEKDEKMFDLKTRSQLLQKISELRKDVLAKDWADDKMFTMPGKGGYPYLSADKVKKTLAPLFAKHGLELHMEFSDLEFRVPIGNMSQHWTIKLTASLVDVDTGMSQSTIVYGEAGDSGDKGVPKAQTCAIKQWVLTEFLIADGIDPDAAVDSVATPGFYKKSQEEKEEVVSKVLAQSIKPTAKEPAKQAPVKPAEAAPEPEKAETPAKPARASKKPAKADEAPSLKVEPAPADVQPAKDAPVAFKPTGPQAKAIKRIEDTWEARAKAGEVTPEEYNAMSMARASMSTPADAVAFIKKFKVS